MKNLIVFVFVFICITTAEISAQPYNWKPERKLTEGYFDSNPNFIQIINHHYSNYNFDYLVFERKNFENDTLSSICVVKIDTGGIQGIPLFLSSGTFEDKNPDICIGNEWGGGINYSLVVWESKRPEGVMIAGRFFDINLGWGNSFIIDSSSDNHNPKISGINNTNYSIVYQSGNDIIYKEINTVNNQTTYRINLTSDDTSYCSKPEIARGFNISNIQICYQQKRTDGNYTVIRRTGSSNHIWSNPEIISDNGDNRTSGFLLYYVGYNTAFESNFNGNWNIYSLRENIIDTLPGINNDANNTSLKRFFDNRVTDGIIYSHAFAYKEEISDEKRIILNSFGYPYYKDTVLINSIENTGLTINGGLNYFNYDFLVWVVYNKTDSGKSSLYGKSVRVMNTGIKEINTNLPDNITLYQNYPNPFNPVTNLEFGIPELGFVSLKVYDALGKVVRTLVNESRPAGYYNVEFDGSDLPSGMYFYKLEAGKFAETKRMILLK